MLTPAYVRTMAAYNRWQNQNLFAAADALPEAERKAPRRAFFGSIHGTLNHLVWADQLWMRRFAGEVRPAAVGIAQSPDLYAHWDDLKRERVALDDAILAWAHALEATWLEGNLSWYSNSAKRELTRPKGLIVAHFFNHQTHHRGQVHCLMTQCGVIPADTDLPIMP
ncbi:MAG TPA: DinB family protein [Hyphomicrobiaceae bacterium]|jgi:uncharacterized damage-inducible protein DinB|nr:DinB family protein [Hyphomicrobiaceae bacterium]